MMKMGTLAVSSLAMAAIMITTANAGPYNPGVQVRYDAAGNAVEGPGVNFRVGNKYKSKIKREMVPYDGGHSKGTIIVDTGERRLYHVLGDGQAMKYGIGVGRPGFEWSGTNRISRKAEWPGWTPPPAMRRRQPDLPAYMPGGPNNPLGARALYIGSTFYRIHGSNEPWTIGQAVSSGCIRMTNEDVTHLYEKVTVGAKVVVKH